MSDRLPRHKGVYILPNLFTTGSLFAAFLGLVWASEKAYELCAMAIFFSALLDGLDGKVARLTGTSSEFGVQYDSLADLVAFGITPAFMMYTMALYPYKRMGIAVAFLFAVCAALRLARFNVSTSVSSKRFFTGLPTPAAGCSLAIIVLILPVMDAWFGPNLASIPTFIRNNFSFISLCLTIFIGLLMVSRIRYAAFKEFGFLKAHPFRYMVFAILIFAGLVTYPRLGGFVLLYGYILSGFIYTFVILPRKNLMTKPADSAPVTTQNPIAKGQDND